MHDDDPGPWDVPTWVSAREDVRGPVPDPGDPDSPYPPLAWWETVRGAWAVTYVAATLAAGAVVAQLLNPDGRYLMALGGSLLGLGLAGSNLRDAYRLEEDGS